ncbi:MAG: hypothetical protein LJE70_02180, partial [Chromatiaceae bacterium]|nr:hypothetical protein [Chromatiaceae bacterium]
LWAKRYERDVDGLFAVLDHLTQAIIAVLLPSQPPEEAAVAPERPAGSGNELSYDSLIDSPRRLKCLYGHVAQMAGDHIAAVRIFQDCIDRWNDVNSMIGLAQIYETGIGVPRDLTAATLLMRRGAQIQDPVGYSSLARYHYGMALVEGKGVAPDTVAGLRWLRRAAAEGIEEASAYIAEHFPAESPVAGQR